MGLRACTTWILLVLGGLAAGSAPSIDIIRYETLPPKPVDHVRVLPERPRQPYKILAQIVVDGDEWQRLQALVDQMKRKAAEMGADAVVVLEAREYQRGSIITPSQSTQTVTGTITNPGGRSSTFTGTTTTQPSPSVVEAILRKRVTELAIAFPP